MKSFLITPAPGDPAKSDDARIDPFRLVGQPTHAAKTSVRKPPDKACTPGRRKDFDLLSEAIRKALGKTAVVKPLKGIGNWTVTLEGDVSRSEVVGKLGDLPLAVHDNVRIGLPDTDMKASDTRQAT